MANLEQEKIKQNANIQYYCLFCYCFQFMIIESDGKAKYYLCIKDWEQQEQ